MDTTLNFNQMQSRTDRTLGVVLWTQTAKNWIVGIFWFAVLDQFVKSLVKSLSHRDRLNALTDEQAHMLAGNIENVLRPLKRVLDINGLCLLKRRAIFRPLIESLEIHTEDLVDIAEDLRLSCNREFTGLVADCVNSVSSAHPAATVGRM